MNSWIVDVMLGIPTAYSRHRALMMFDKEEVPQEEKALVKQREHYYGENFKSLPTCLLDPPMHMTDI